MMEYSYDYYYNLVKIQSQTGKVVADLRWAFILKHLSPDSVLDYGCGVGFFKAFAPEGIIVDTYDIMPVIQTGIRCNMYNLICLYDVLEHIPDFTELLPILRKTDNVIVTVPIKPALMLWKDYKHFKPGEHLHYFTDDLLTHIFETLGFGLLAKGQPECPPRQHIWTYIFKRLELIEGGEEKMADKKKAKKKKK